MKSFKFRKLLQRWQRPYLSHTYPYPYMCEVRKISHLAPFAPLRYGTCARCRTFYRTFRTSQKVQKRCERYASAPRTSLGTYAGTKAYLSHLGTSRTFRTWGAAPFAPFAPYELTKNYAFSVSVNHQIITFNLFKISLTKFIRPLCSVILILLCLLLYDYF